MIFTQLTSISSLLFYIYPSYLPFYSFSIFTSIPFTYLPSFLLLFSFLSPFSSLLFTSLHFTSLHFTFLPSSFYLLLTFLLNFSYIYFPFTPLLPLSYFSQFTPITNSVFHSWSPILTSFSSPSFIFPHPKLIFCWNLF